MVAHELNRAPHDWQRLGSREHLARALQDGDKAATGAAGGDHLTEAAVGLVFALELREREAATAQDLRMRMDARRVR